MWELTERTPCADSPSDHGIPVGAVLATALATALVYFVVSRFVAPVALAGSGPYDGGFRVADFLFETRFTWAYWTGEIGSPYVPAEQARVLAELGSGGDVAVPFAMSPVSLVLLAPFAWLAEVDFVASYSAWVAVSFGALLLGLMAVYARLPREHAGPRVLFLVGAVAVVASRVGWRAIAMADTVPLAAVGFLTMLLLVPGRATDGRPVRAHLLLAAAYLLTAWKIHYVGLAAGLHFLLGDRREAMAYGAGAAIVAVLVPAAFDPHLATTYAGELLHFAGGGYGDQLRRLGRATAGGSGATLRHAVAALGAPDSAKLVAWVVLAAAGVGLLVDDLRRAPQRQGSEGGFRFSRPAATRAFLLFAAFLVLMPYLGRYDDFFLLVPLGVLCLTIDRLPSRPVAVAGVLALIVATYLPGPGVGGDPVILLALKVAALGSLLLLLLGGGGFASSAVDSRNA